ncbi:MAG: response regulator transcription factor [Opitutaceae bacterium]|nr:response regulator transcription factor [Opitutaceae bacterium]
MRILIVEDEPQLARHLRAALTRHGHTVEVEGQGDAALKLALTRQHDLILLDINLPALDGREILRQIRATHAPTLVMMLTARGEVGDRIKGLAAGADDYLGKPFAMDELIARVEALARRGAPAAGTVLEVSDLRMSVPQREVTRGGALITLSPREFDLLQVLMQEPGRTFARSELSRLVWQGECADESRTVDMFILRLRKKIDAGARPPLIHTLRAVGYTIRSPEAPPNPPCSSLS